MALKRRPEFDSKKGGLQKLWTQAPEANVSSLLELFHTNPRLDADIVPAFRVVPQDKIPYHVLLLVGVVCRLVAISVPRSALCHI